VRELAKAQWQSYFGVLGPSLRARVVEVEAGGLAEISYNPAADLLAEP
jgi:hypothetical protein